MSRLPPACLLMAAGSLVLLTTVVYSQPFPIPWASFPITLVEDDEDGEGASWLGSVFGCPDIDTRPALVAPQVRTDRREAELGASIGPHSDAPKSFEEECLESSQRFGTKRPVPSPTEKHPLKEPLKDIPV